MGESITEIASFNYFNDLMNSFLIIKYSIWHIYMLVQHMC
jgi:hypothetical protein